MSDIPLTIVNEVLFPRAGKGAGAVAVTRTRASKSRGKREAGRQRDVARSSPRRKGQRKVSAGGMRRGGGIEGGGRREKSHRSHSKEVSRHERKGKHRPRSSKPVVEVTAATQGRGKPQRDEDGGGKQEGRSDVTKKEAEGKNVEEADERRRARRRKRESERLALATMFPKE